MKTTLIILCTFLVTGCATQIGGGVEGRYINDGLPKAARLFQAEWGDRNAYSIIPGTEAGIRVDLIWNRLNEVVPCSAIKEVGYLDSGVNKNTARLILVGHQYGGKYYPPVKSRSIWFNPSLWATNMTTLTAEKLATYCDVELRIHKE